MRKFLLASLLALPTLALSTPKADAFFCFQGTYSFKFPRIAFAIDTGDCCPKGHHGHAPGGLQPFQGGAGPFNPGGPWYVHYPPDQHAAPAGQAAAHGLLPQAPAPTAKPSQPPTGPQPAAYWPNAYNTNYYQYAPATSAPPSYWYGR